MNIFITFDGVMMIASFIIIAALLMEKGSITIVGKGFSVNDRGERRSEKEKEKRKGEGSHFFKKGI